MALGLCGVLTLAGLGNAVAGVVITGGGALPIYVLALSSAAAALIAGGTLSVPRPGRTPRLVFGALAVPNLLVLPWMIWFAGIVPEDAIAAVQLANFLVILATPLVVVVGAPRPDPAGTG